MALGQTGLVQQRVQIAAARDLTLVVMRTKLALLLALSAALTPAMAIDDSVTRTDAPAPSVLTLTPCTPSGDRSLRQSDCPFDPLPFESLDPHAAAEIP